MTAPDDFAFGDVTDVPLNILIESNTITVTGITALTSIAITIGEYSVNGGGYTASGGVVANGDTIKVRHTTNTGFSSATDTTLTIGGVSDTFTSTTLAADTNQGVDTTQAADSDVIVGNESGGGGGGGGGGCTLTDSRALDPIFPLLLLISVGYLVRRRPQV